MRTAGSVEEISERSQLERDRAAAYFESLSTEELREERELERVLCTTPGPNVSLE